MHVDRTIYFILMHNVTGIFSEISEVIESRTYQSMKLGSDTMVLAEDFLQPTRMQYAATRVRRSIARHCITAELGTLLSIARTIILGASSRSLA